MDVTHEQVDRNDLLASTRAVFVRSFVDGLEASIKLSAESLFAKADRGATFQAQRRLLDARGVLEKKSFDVKMQMKKAMEKLLHRSFQTTYSNYRPSFSNSILEGPISLIDTSVFEDELRFNTITDRFRNEAGEQLRDLNIRIALLFEQDNIRERENPFRPYLFSRAIAMAVENVDAPPDLHTTLTDQLAEDFASNISAIYAAVNSHLAENGIAAQLMLKPKRSPEARRRPSDDEIDSQDFLDSPARYPAGGAAQGRAPRPSQHQQTGAFNSAGQDAASYGGGQGAGQTGAFMQQASRQQSAPGAQQPPAEVSQSPVERLFNSVKALASRPFRNAGARGANDGGAATNDGAPVGADNTGEGGGMDVAGGMVETDDAQGGQRAGAGPSNATSGQLNAAPESRGSFGGGTSLQGGASGGNGGDGGHYATQGAARGDAAMGGASGSEQATGADGGYAQGAPSGNAPSGGQDDAEHGATGRAVQAGGTPGGRASAGMPHAGAGGGSANDASAGGHDHAPGGEGGARNAAAGNNASGAGAGAQRMGDGGADAYASSPGDGAEQPQAAGAASTGEAAQESADRAKPSWLSGKKAVGEVLRKFFAGKSTPDDFADDFDDTAEESAQAARPAVGLLAGSVQRLLRYETPSTPEMYAGNGEIRNLIMERRANLNDVAHNAKEQMTIDIVSMLFEFILRDTQVPAEVRAQLGRLQFLVLKIALRDESLLTTKAHPARMLVNRIGSISLGLKQIDPSGANVTAEICRIVEAILADETESPSLFLKMLDDLDSFIARELLVSDKGVSDAVEVVEHAESRTLRLAHTCAQMSEALQGLTINEHLQNFLENDWARAIEYAERTTPELAAEYRRLVPDLLWSVLPKVTEEDRQQLLQLLPPILKTIHGGMEPVGWPAANKQTLMDWLFDTHTVVLRGANSLLPPTSFSSIHTHFRKFVDNAENAPPATVPTISSANRKGYLEEAMRELDVRINLLDHFFDDDPDLADDAISVSDAANDGEAAQADLDITERLRIGVAIEVNLGGKPSAGRLNWINPNASNLVLTLNDQAEPSMISVRMFQRLLNNDRVRFLEAEPIFERAVESLLISASQVG